MEVPLTILDHLARRNPTAKRQTLRKMLQDGRVTLNGKAVISAKTLIGNDDKIAVRPMRVAVPSRKKSPLDIIHEDDDILVVNKPPELLTSTGPKEKRATLLEMVRRHLKEGSANAGRGLKVGLIHRLDRDAAGLLVFSKNDAAYHSLKTQFFHHTVRREYLAVVHGATTPHSGRIESRLIERADGTVRSTDEHAKGETAVTMYETVHQRKGESIVLVKLHTGRKHQIRVHLSERGNPIVNDPLYGGKKKPAGPLMLVALRLGFEHPRTKKNVLFEIDPPKHFALPENK